MQGNELIQYFRNTSIATVVKKPIGLMQLDGIHGLSR